MTDMYNHHQTIVADHIADLQREAAILRAERERDRRRKHAATGTDPTAHPTVLPSRRVRIGRWLVAVGEAIAGTRRSSSREGRSMAASGAAADDPCGDGHDRLAPAA